MLEFHEDTLNDLWLTSTAGAPVRYRACAALPTGEVWEQIAPAIPDVLKAVHGGVYEAKWWHPVPQADVETLLHLEGIAIIGQPYEPADLPMGCAVRFSIMPPLF